MNRNLVDESIEAIATLIDFEIDEDRNCGSFVDPASEKYARIVNSRRGYLALWNAALEPGNPRDYKWLFYDNAIQMLVSSINSGDEARAWLKARKEQAVANGLDSMLEAFVAGVPVADILA